MLSVACSKKIIGAHAPTNMHTHTRRYRHPTNLALQRFVYTVCVFIMVMQRNALHFSTKALSNSIYLSWVVVGKTFQYKPP